MRAQRFSAWTIAAAAILIFAVLPARALAQRGLPHLIDPPPGSVQFGRSVASGGDANGDGVDDLFISDPGFEVDGVRVGRWFVYDGATREEMWRAVGEASLGYPEGLFAFSIPAAFIGDIDGDSGDDLIVGTPTASESYGAAIVYSGRTGAVLHRFDGDQYYRVGIDVAGVGDVNADGMPDFAFVARHWEEGLVSIRSGRDGSELHLIEQIIPRRIRGLGDIDGDGHDDVVISAFRYSNDPHISIVSGRTGEVRIIRSPGGWREDGFGYALAGGADVTGDHVSDLLVGSHVNWTQRVVYVISGATLEIVNTMYDPRGNQPFGIFGVRVEFGDMNGDGAFEALIAEAGGVGVYESSTGRLIQWHAAGFSTGVYYGNEFSTGSFNGDHFTDLFAPLRSGEVALYGGAPLLLSLSNVHHSHYLVRGSKYAFFVHGAQPGRRVYFLASLTGHGCTFIPRLGVCIDLDPRIHRLGHALTNGEGFAELSLEVGSRVPAGPLWLQAIDPADPARGPITSNVMLVEIVD